MLQIFQALFRCQMEFPVKEVHFAGNGKFQKRIFEKFFQGDTAHTTEGNGLGLSLVKRIVDLCGGSIDVESMPGKGTAFMVYLPLEN